MAIQNAVQKRHQKKIKAEFKDKDNDGKRIKTFEAVQ